MRIKFTRPELQEAIGNAISCVSNKNTITAVEGILIKTENGKVILTSYDLEKGMRIEMDAEIIEEGSCVINAQSLNSIIRVMPAGVIDLKVNNYYKVTLSSGNSEFELNAMSASDYPTLPDISNNSGFGIKQEELKKLINQTIFAVAQNDARSTFNGTFFKINGKNITAVGCDSFRLAVRNTECDVENYMGEEINTSFIIPGKTLSEVVKFLDSPDSIITINISRKQVIFRFTKKNIVFFSRLIEGDYIDYERIIPRNSSITVDVDADVFESALNRASLVTDESAGKNKSLARCYFHDNKLEITSESINGKAYDEISTSHTGPEIKIGFNCRYLTDALKASMCDKLRLSMSSPNISMVIEPLEKEEKGSFIFLVLPCKM